MESLNTEFLSQQKEDKAKNNAENYSIPKHRFDCVNLCLKETRQTLKDKTQECEELLAKNDYLKSLLTESMVEALLTKHGAKNLTATKALIDFSELNCLDKNLFCSYVEEQILQLKSSQSFLFNESEQTAYVLLPLKKGEQLKDTVNNFLKNSRRTKK